MSLNDEIREYLLKNPHLMRSKYADTAKKFGTNYEQIRTVARNLRKKSRKNQRSKRRQRSKRQRSKRISKRKKQS